MNKRLPPLSPSKFYRPQKHLNPRERVTSVREQSNDEENVTKAVVLTDILPKKRTNDAIIDSDAEADTTQERKPKRARPLNPPEKIFLGRTARAINRAVTKQLLAESGGNRKNVGKKLMKKNGTTQPSNRNLSPPDNTDKVNVEIEVSEQTVTTTVDKLPKSPKKQKQPDDPSSDVTLVSPNVKKNLLDNAPLIPMKQQKNHVTHYQPMIDAGQRHLGAVQCPSCGMVYTKNHAEDASAHDTFHSKYFANLRFPKAGWKSVPSIQDVSGNIYHVIYGSKYQFATKKVLDVCEIVDQELGYAERSVVWREGRQAFILAKSTGDIVGCCVVEPIKAAYANAGEGRCSEKVSKAMMGVNRLWVAYKERKKGIATRLVDAARCSFMCGAVVPKSKVAFSDPTLAGKQFAEHYCGNDTFLVYQPV